MIHPAPDKEWPATEINNAPRKAFVHRHVTLSGKRITGIKPCSITSNPLLVSESNPERLPQNDATILDLLKNPAPTEAVLNPALRIVSGGLERSGRDNTTAVVVQVCGAE